jgi:translation initiation factor 4B
MVSSGSGDSRGSGMGVVDGVSWRFLKCGVFGLLENEGGGERWLCVEAEAEAEAEASTNGKQEEEAAQEEAKPEGDATDEQANGTSAEQKLPSRPREPKEQKDLPNYKSRAAEASTWRSASSEQRGPRDAPRGPRGGRGGPRGGARHEGRPSRSNGPPSQQSESAEPQTPTKDDDGWTTVPKKRGTGRLA